MSHIYSVVFRAPSHPIFKQAYIGTSAEKVKTSDINNARQKLGLEDYYILFSCSYLGAMSLQEFQN